MDEWTRYFPSDFRDDFMLNAIKSIRHKIIKIDDTLVDENFNKIISTLSDQIRNLEKYEDYLRMLNAEMKLKLRNDLTHVWQTWLHVLIRYYTTTFIL